VVNGFVDIDILRSAFHKNEENSWNATLKW
jgi:hypothetical protein